MLSLFKNVGVVSLYVKDWERAKKFYREILGWPVVWESDEAGWEEYGYEDSAHVSINRWDGLEPMPPARGGTTLVLSVADAHRIAEELRAKGVKYEDVITIPGVVTLGHFYDPDGNRIQFAEDNPPSAA
jgi:catechol 2,3-dioxygenase-like lactoylglutathione lyase family enzyme